MGIEFSEETLEIINKDFEYVEGNECMIKAWVKCDFMTKDRSDQLIQDFRDRWRQDWGF